MRSVLQRLLLTHALELVTAACAYLLARYLLELSTPAEDWRDLRSWWTVSFELRWYRGPEYRHQLRGSRLLWSALVG